MDWWLKRAQAPTRHATQARKLRAGEEAESWGVYWPWLRARSDGSANAAVVSGAEGWRRHAASQGFRRADNPAVQQGHRQRGQKAAPWRPPYRPRYEDDPGADVPDARTRYNRDLEPSADLS